MVEGQSDKGLPQPRAVQAQRWRTVTRKLPHGNVKNPSPHAHRSNVVQVLEVCAAGARGCAEGAGGSALYGVRCVLSVLGVMFCMLFCVLLCMLLCILEAAEGDLCLLEVLEVMRCVPLWILGAVEGWLCLLEAPDVMRCMLLCTLEAVEG